MEQVLVYAGTVTFAVTGALVGVQKRFDVVGVLILAVVTAVGGGIIRDVLSGEVPGVMYRSGDFYASAAAAGALVTFALHGVSPTAAVVAGAVVAVGIRLGSRLAGVRLPVPRSEA